MSVKYEPGSPEGRDIQGSGRPGVSISARLPQGEETGSVAVHLAGQDLHLLATRLDALESVLSQLQDGIVLLRQQEGAKDSGRPGDTRILLGRSAIPDPKSPGGTDPVTRYAVPLAEDEIMATAALEFYDDERRSVVVGFVVPGSEKGPDTNVQLRWGLRDEILRELHEHLKKRFEA